MAFCLECRYLGTYLNEHPCVDCAPKKEHPMFEPKEGKEKQPEAVEHPSHYNREGAMECIDEMVLIFGREAVKSFCLCNAWKYRYRAADKNGEEDLKKSDWYIKKYKEINNGKVCDELRDCETEEKNI